jgi:ABC-type transport system substrate-binding protein
VFRVSNCCLSTYQPELLADMFSKVGIKVDIEVVEHAVHLRTSERGQYDQMAHHLFAATDPSDVWNGFVPGNPRNLNHVDDPVLTEMILAQQSVRDPIERKAIMDKIAVYLAGQVYVVRYPSRYNDWAWQPVRFNPGGAIERAWVDKQ